VGEDVRLRSAGNPAGPEPADTRTPSRLLAQPEAGERALLHFQRRHIVLNTS